MAEVTLTISAEDSASQVLTKVTEGLDKLSKGAKTAGDANKGLGEKSQGGVKGIQDLGNTVDSLAHQFGELLSPATLLGTFIGVELVGQLRSAIAETSNFALEMQRLTLVTGGSAEKIGELQEAANKLGVGAGMLNRAFFFLSSEIEAGGQNLVKFGVATRDADGAQRSTLDIMERVSEKFRNMESATERAVAARKLFSRSGAVMLPLFELEREQLEKLGESGREFNRVFGIDSQKSAILLKGSMDEIHEAFARTHITMIMDILPAIKAVADAFAYAVDIFWKIPKPLRTIAEVIAATGIVLVGTTLIVKGLSAALNALFVSLNLTSLTGFAIGIGGMAIPIGIIVTALTALILLGPSIYQFFSSLIPQGVINKLIQFKDSLLATIAEFKRAILPSPQPAFTDEGTRALARVGAEIGRGDREKNLAELQIELQLKNRLLQSEMALAKATQSTTDAALKSSKVQEETTAGEIEIELKKLSDSEDADQQILERRRILEKALLNVHKAGAAERTKIAADEVVQRLNLQNQVTQAEIAATMAGEDAAKATFNSTVNLARATYDVSRKNSDDKNKFITDVEKAEFVYLGTSIKLAEAHRDAVVALASQEASTRLAGLKITEDAVNAALDNELTARQHDLDNFKITQRQFTEIAIATADKQLESKQRVITQEAIDTEKNRLAQIENVELAIKDETQKADAIKKINADAYAKLVSLGGDELKAEQENTRKRVQYEYDATKLIEQITTEATGRNITAHVEELEKLRNQHLGNADMLRAIDADLFKDRKTLYDQQVQQAIDAALKETDLYQNEARKQIAIKAGQIEQIESLQQEAIKKSATVLEDQARQAGDLGAAYQVGFAEAASSADDAFKVMKKSGAEAYQSLKSSLSDFLFNFITGASTIGDTFINLGKRILRSFTDVFAEILAKQALLAAGFSLPGLLGTAGTAIAATAGFEGAPNQTATAVQQLGTSATTASQTLGSMTGMTGTVIQMFAFLTTGVGKFIGFLSSLLQTAGVPGNIASGLGSLVAGGGLSFGLGSLIFGGGGGGLGSGLGGLLGTGLGTLIPGFGTELLGGLLGPQLFTSLFSTLGPAIFGAVSNIVLPGIGFVIGGLLGNIFGGLFSGPTPEISGQVQLNSTNIQALLAATRAVPFSSGPGPNQVNNPPDRSNFSFLDTGPLHSELFKHRTQGTLSREESQLDIQNVILATLQAAVKGLSQLGSRLPTEALSKALSTRIDAVLSKGFDITNFDFEGDVEEVVQNFQDFLKGLSSQTVTALTKDIFPSIDLTALGAGDAAKGFDVLASALGGFSSLLVKSGHATAFAGDSIDRFATRSVDFFTQFTKDGEVLADTITRVSQQIGQMIDQLDAFHISTDQFLLGLQTHISTLSLQSGGGLGEFNLLRDVAPGIIGAFSRDVQLQFLSPLIASLKEQTMGAIEANAPMGDVLAGRQQIVGFGMGLFQSLQGEADPIKAIQGLQLLAKGAEDLLAGEIEGAKAYYAKQISLAQAAADARIAQLEEEKKTIQLNTSAIEAQIAAAEAHISQLEVEKRGIEESTKGLENQIKALEDLGHARLAPLQEEQRLLQDQLSTLQQQAQAVQAWKGVLDSVTKQLTDLRLSSSNPQNALERLNIAQQLVSQAKAKFAAEGTPEAATALQQALGDELKIAQEAFQRPSSAYQHIFDQVSADLQQIQSVADTHAVGLEHLTREIATRQARIETLNQQIKEIEQQTREAVRPLNAQLEALKVVNAVRLQEIATEEAQIQTSVQPLREQLQAMRADAATRLHAIEAEEAQVRSTLQTTIAGLMSQQDSTIQGFREEATGWLRAIRNEAMVRLEQAVREGNAEIARLLGLPPTLDPRFTQASQGLMSLAQLAQGGGLPDIATSLATSSRFLGKGQLPDALTAAMRALAQAQGTPALQTGIGPEIISRFSSVIRDTQAGLYDPAIASLNNLVQLLRNAGLGEAPVPGFASGLEYVPRDDFQARLHRGERVLTAEENRLFSSQEGGGIQISFSPTVQVTLHGDSSSAEVRDKLDAAIASLLTGSSRTRQGLVRFAREHR